MTIKMVSKSDTKKFVGELKCCLRTARHRWRLKVFIEVCLDYFRLSMPFEILMCNSSDLNNAILKPAPKKGNLLNLSDKPSVIKISFWRSVLILFLLLSCFVGRGRCNSPPRFVLESSSTPAGGDIVIRLKEGQSTPPGTKIYNIRGFDPDGDKLHFGVQRGRDSDLVRVANLGNSQNEAAIYLEQELDAEARSEYQLVLTLTDGHLGDGNFITQSMLILVEDTNDNAPIFKPYSPVIQIREHSPPQVIATLEATDKDSGIFGQVVYLLGDAEVDRIGEMFAVTRTPDGKGVVRLIGDPDYEKKSVYQLKILATDRSNFGGVNTATAAILVEIEDIPDKPPEFVSVPSITRISEDVPKFTEVLQVRAVDGDRGINRPITYSILDGPTGDIFAISPDTGIVYTQKPIDREGELSTNGAVILTIRAREVGGPYDPFVDTEVTIMIEDVNDETPTFRSPIYSGEVSENAQKGTPIHFLGVAIPEVFDHDRGTNGTFSLNIEGDEGIFEVIPEKVINEATFVIRVKDSTLLDFETLKVVNLTLVAKELTEVNPKETKVPVTVYIRDTNDNHPEFESSIYDIYVPEDLPFGGTIVKIKATDIDSGQFGTSGIRYTSLGGPLAGFLTLNAETGVVTLSNQSKFSPFDREKSSLHYFTVEARDDLGKGNRNSVELVVHVKDVNDNAPKFERENYEWVLPENSPDFPIPFFVYAFDADENGTENAEVRYQIISGDSAGNFTIDSITGEIRPRGTVDFELVVPDENTDSRRFNLTIRAYDLGEPTMFSDVPITIYITDENDYEPVFDNPFYLVSVREDIAEGSEILTLNASDADGSSPNNDVIYRITSGAKDKFVVDPESGVLSVSRGAILDPDVSIPRATSYFLEVTAFDGGIGTNKLSGKTNVNISIIDVNNKMPEFEPSSFEPVTIAENVEKGHFVTRILAKDLDHSSDLHYTWVGAESFDEAGNLVLNFDATTKFAINEINGDVFVVGKLDREIVEQVKLFVSVEDFAAEKEQQVTEGTLEILIDDVNDNDPVFDSDSYKSSIQENAPSGTVILKVSATDADKNKTVKYSIRASDEIKHLIQISPTSGEISVSGTAEDRIDREMIEWMNFTVKVTDSGIPPRSNFVDVSVRVIDQNDHGPEFTESMFNITVREDTPPGTVIAVLEAADLDFGEFGKVTYFLDRQSSVGHFKIHPDTGELTVSEALDREEQDRFNLIVQAYDNYQYGFTLGESRHTFCQVMITVTDVNDRRPVFEERLPDDSCYIITEFHDRSEPVMTIRASDGDDPQTPNGQLNFEILSGDDGKLFRLEPSGKTSAKIYPNKSLKGNYGNYTLTVQANDRGKPPNSASVQYSICVQDFNDNPPLFVSPTRNHTIRVYENASLNSEVTRVRAVDVDIGSNGAVRYRLRQDPLENYKSFAIDEMTGIITLKRELDRERQKVYDLRVEAYDLGVPTQLQSDLDLTVYVKNVNDNEPQFLVDTFAVNFTENKSPGSERSVLVGTVDRDEDEEFELEENPNLLDVCYFIVGGDDDQKNFDLHPLRHELIAVRELDREFRSEYTLIVRATEQCLPDNEADSVEFDPDDDSLLRVVVNVLDVDDNPPVFDRKVFTGGIATDGAEFGSVILSLIALDPDENSFLTFALSSEAETSASSEGLENINKPPFLVDPSTGDITVNFDAQKGMKGYFEFSVSVTDAAGHSDDASVQIYLLRADQRVRFVMRNRPSAIRERIDDFRAAIANVTDSIVNVDALEIHEQDPTKTDVLLHFVDSRDNSVMDVAEILKIIDYRTEQLDPLFREFNVLNTDGYDPAFLLKAASSETVVILWLAAIIVFLVLLLVIVISLCIHQRRKFARRLKAAMAALPTTQIDPGSPTDLRKRRSDGAVFVPNTNKHAVEGSNPIWMTGYDNVTFGFDDADSSLTGGDIGRNTFDRLERELNSDKDRQLDSLDANILNVESEKDLRALGSDDDIGYSASHFSGGEGSSTIRVGSTITKMIKGDSPPLRSTANSRSSQSSGLGSASGSSRLQPRSNYVASGSTTSRFNLKKNNNPMIMFPTQMPAVDRSNGSRANSAKRYGFTTYDEDDVPRTEL